MKLSMPNLSWPAVFILSPIFGLVAGWIIFQFMLAVGMLAPGALVYQQQYYAPQPIVIIITYQPPH
jgi:hypothetical protein